MTARIVILARKGSRGLPGKNEAIIGGRPCVCWTIDHARRAAADEVVLSTDSPALLTLAESMGIATIERPPELATDTARVDDALRHASGDASRIVMLYANVPVRPPGIIDEALRLLERTGADSVQSFTPVGKFHPWWQVRIDDDGSLHPWEGDTLFHGTFRRQDLPPSHVPDGAVTVVTREALHLELGVAPGPHAFLGRDRRGVITPEGSVIDIDGHADLVRADLALRR